MRRSYNGRSHHKLVSEMTADEHFKWNEEKRLEQSRRRKRRKIKELIKYEDAEE